MWRVTNSPRWCCVSRSMAKWCSRTVMLGCLRTEVIRARSISAPVRSSWWRIRCSVCPPSRLSSKRPSGVLSNFVPQAIRSRISSGGPANYQFDGCGVAFAGTADQGVVNMFFERVGRIGHRTDASLGIVGVALVHFPFRYQCNVAVFCGFEGETQSGGAGSDDQKIGFHGFQRLDRPR